MTVQISDDVASELVDAVVAAADTGRRSALIELRRVMADIGLASSFDQELALSGAESFCECWPGDWL